MPDIAFWEAVRIATPIIIPLLILVLTMIVNAALARAAERRKHRLDYLIETYRALCSVSTLDDPDQYDRVRKAIDDIYLLGNKQQVAAAEALAQSLAAPVEDQASPDQLLAALRAALRKELKIRGGRPDPLRIAPQTPEQRQERELTMKQRLALPSSPPLH
jgi:hypothetical protein